jgi:SWI/SNF-related matrix-associated actin-dependent regulator 1 of chromatin subfamily A
MIRRLKKDVLKDLPAKIRSVVPLELENRDEYERAVEDFLGWLERHETELARKKLETEQFVEDPDKLEQVAKRVGKAAADRAAGAEALVSIGKLKQLAARGKIKTAVSWIRDVVEQDEKIIVFAVHHWVVDRLMEEFGAQAVRLTGKESQEQRQEAVDRFQNDDSVRVFVGNVAAAGVGITLTAASHVCFMELPWTPGAVCQAEDRAHRIGQEQTVNVYYLVAEGTIEEDIAEMLDRKADVLGQVLDGKKAKEESILGELLRKMKEKKNG